MPVHRGMPVVATIKGRRQFSGRGGIRVAIQRVADVIWILFVHAGKCKTRKPLRRFVSNSAAFWAAALIVKNKNRAQKDNFIG